jgi:hypothetical protein
MNRLIFVFLLTISLKGFAQTDQFDKVIVNYGKGHNSWVIPGPYASEEQFEFVPAKKGGYKLNADLKFEFSLNKDSVEVIDTVAAPFHKYKVAKTTIDSLYADFSITKPNFTYTFIRPYLKTPDTTQIFAIATKMGQHDKFEDYNPQELAERVKPIQLFDKIDYFINVKRPDPEIATVTTDVAEGINVYFIKNKDTTSFRCNLLRPLGQPLLKRWENHKFVDKQFVNLDVNILLEGMLPISSDAKKRIAINTLTEDYIKWYIEKVL